MDVLGVFRGLWSRERKSAEVCEVKRDVVLAA